MNISLDWAIPQITVFILVVSRLSGLFLLAPVFSSPLIPGRIKAMALLALSLCMTPMVAHETTKVPTTAIDLGTAIVVQTLIGLALGFAVSVIFAAVQTGASLIDMSIGFSLANIIDPSTNTHVSIFSSFYTMVATLSFLAINGHYWLLTGFVRSFNAIALDEIPNFNKLFAGVEEVFLQLFAIAFQIAAPILVTLLLADVVLGVIARVVPQMNVFFVGIPLKIGVGLAAVIITIPSFVNLFEAKLSTVLSGAAVFAHFGGG